MVKPIVVAAAVVAVSLGPLSARAATIQIEVRNVEFLPAGAAAAAGDTVRFATTSGNHDIDTYAGAMPDAGLMSAGQSVDVTFPGGTSRYRCTFHSTLASGVCDGMCGIVTDSPPAIPLPVITSPADGSTITTPGATVTGTAASPATRVKIYDGNNFLGDADVSGGSFSRGFNFAGGSHTLTAISLDGDGFESPVSAEVSFTVDLADTGPPTVVLNEPDALLDTNPLGIAGIATDDKLLVSVEVEIRNLLTGQVIEPEVSCPACGTASSVFNAQSPVPIGIHEVLARARDGLGRVGEVSATVVMVL